MSYRRYDLSQKDLEAYYKKVFPKLLDPLDDEEVFFFQVNNLCIRLLQGYCGTHSVENEWEKPKPRLLGHARVINMITGKCLISLDRTFEKLLGWGSNGTYHLYNEPKYQIDNWVETVVRARAEEKLFSVLVKN